MSLERLNIFSLPALRAFGYIKLDRLALLQALETSRLHRRKVHKHIFAILSADKTIALGVVEPLYCSLFCHVGNGVPFNQFTLERFGGDAGRCKLVSENCLRPIRSNAQSRCYAFSPSLSKKIAVMTAQTLNARIRLPYLS